MLRHSTNKELSWIHTDYRGPLLQPNRPTLSNGQRQGVIKVREASPPNIILQPISSSEPLRTSCWTETTPRCNHCCSISTTRCGDRLRARELSLALCALLGASWSPPDLLPPPPPQPSDEPTETLSTLGANCISTNERIRHVRGSSHLPNFQEKERRGAAPFPPLEVQAHRHPKHSLHLLVGTPVCHHRGFVIAPPITADQEA